MPLYIYIEYTIYTMHGLLGYVSIPASKGFSHPLTPEVLSNRFAARIERHTMGDIWDDPIERGGS